MKRSAKVIGVASSDSVLVELESINRCLRCSRGEGCGAMLSSTSSSSAPLQIHCAPSVKSSQMPQEGQHVMVEFDDSGSSWLWLVFGLFGLPLMGMLVACAFAVALTGQMQHITGHDVAALSQHAGQLIEIVAAALGLSGGFFAWRLLAPQARAVAQHSLCLQSARIVAINPSL